MWRGWGPTPLPRPISEGGAWACTFPWLVDNPARIIALAEAIKKENAEEISSLVHTIKCSATAISAKSLVEAASQLESDAIEGNLKNAQIMFVDIQKKFEKVKSFVSQPNWIQIATKLTDSKEVKQVR